MIYMSLESNDINKENLNGTATFPATCQEYYERGTSTNGTYKIRPSLELHSFYVECEFTDDLGITLLRPRDWKSDGFTYPANDSDRCHTPDCFTKSIDYGITVEQIQVFIVKRMIVDNYLFEGINRTFNKLSTRGSASMQVPPFDWSFKLDGS